MLAVHRDGEENGPYKDFIERRRRVLDALLWLRQNNPQYEHVEKYLSISDRSSYMDTNAHTPTIDVPKYLLGEFSAIATVSVSLFFVAILRP